VNRGIIWPDVGATQTRGAGRRRVWRQGLLLAAAAWVAGLGAWQLPGADRLERELTLPWLFARRGPLPAPAEAVIFAIDSASARRLGLPSRFADWPRRIYADLIRRATAGGASVIAIDVFFARARLGDGDAALAAAIAEAGNVVLFGQMKRQVQALPGAGADGQLQVDTLRRPHRAFAEAAAAVAPFVLPKSPARVDTVWVHHPAMPGLATLPAAAVRVQAGDVACPVGAAATPAQQAVCELERGPQERMLNFYGPPHSVRIVSAADVLQGDVPDLAGRAVFVGHVEPYFPNQTDSFLTAVSRPDGLDLSGVEIAATAYLNALRREFLVPASPLAVAAGLLVTAMGLAAAFMPVRPPAAGALALILAGAASMAVLAAFGHRQLWLPLTPWLVQIVVALLGALALRARHSGRERAQVAAEFRHYLPAHVVRQIARASADAPARLAATQQQAACLVSDAAGYATLAERLPPGDLRELMNRYYAALLAPISAQGGMVTDIVGDSALALWPIRQADIAQRLRACRAALDIQAALTAFEVPGGGGLPTRIGLHVGELMLGPVGALDHFEYRAVGDAVNTASRIEGLNKHLGTRILASAATVGGLPGIDSRPVGRFQLAGKAQALDIHELLPVPSAAQAAARAPFAAALGAFEAGDAVGARRGFQAVLAIDPGDTVAAFYLEILHGLAQERSDKVPNDGVIAVPK
jgi:adenylate cyclase